VLKLAAAQQVLRAPAWGGKGRAQRSGGGKSGGERGWQVAEKFPVGIANSSGMHEWQSASCRQHLKQLSRQPGSMQ
jgi:hypothetical protein